MLPVSDAHAHVSSGGLGGSLVGRKFREVGGWFMALVSLPPTHYGLEVGLDGIVKSFEIHVSECSKARAEGLEIVCMAGVHPAFVDEMIRVTGVHRIDKVVSVVSEALKRLKLLRVDGLVEGFGEFGRPHYKTLPESVAVNEVVLREVLEMGKDTDSVVHLHTEQGGVATVSSIDALVRLVGIPRERVVFHHASTAVVRAAEELGYYSTVLGHRDPLRNVLLAGASRVLIESDFIDDPRRPGVAMYPWELTREIDLVLGEGVENAGLLQRYLVSNVEAVYGVVFKG
ncbi:MAG: TatD family hydrolase [Zestosphaera sp.]